MWSASAPFVCAPAQKTRRDEGHANLEAQS